MYVIDHLCLVNSTLVPADGTTSAAPNLSDDNGAINEDGDDDDDDDDDGDNVNVVRPGHDVLVADEEAVDLDEDVEDDEDPSGGDISSSILQDDNSVNMSVE